MNDPVAQVPDIIQNLTSRSVSSSLNLLDSTVSKYFTPDVSFNHPLVTVPSFSGSRDHLLGIYRWYKVLFVKVDLEVLDIVLEEKSNRLFIRIKQSCTYRYVKRTATVNLLTVLSLKKADNHGEEIYFIHNQTDLYQTEDLIHFIVPWGRTIVGTIKTLAGLFCYLLSLIAIWLGVIMK